MNQTPKRVLVLLATLAVSAFSGGAVLALEPGEPPDPTSDEPSKYVPGEVLVTFKDGASKEEKDKVKAKVKAKVKEKVFGTEIERLTVEGTTESAVHELKDEPGVEGAQPNFLYQLYYTPNDAMWVKDSTTQYGPRRIRAAGAWQNALGDIGGTSNPEIGIIDTGWDVSNSAGTDTGHPDLKSKISGQYDCARDDASADDEHGHGTHVAGIAAAATMNATGIAGVAPDAEMFIGKVYSRDAATGRLQGATSDSIECGNRAIAAGVEVINMSFGSTTYDAAFDSAVQTWLGKNVNVVAAVGNHACSGSNPSAIYPASFAGVFGAAATDINNNRACYSDYGSRVDIAAPGTDIMSTVPGGYTYISGTSMAAPHVAGVVALVRSKAGFNDRLTAQRRIVGTAVDLGPAGNDNYYGNGLVNADAAVGN